MSRNSAPPASSDTETRGSLPSSGYMYTNQATTSTHACRDRDYGYQALEQMTNYERTYQYPDPELHQIRPGSFYYPVADATIPSEPRKLLAENIEQSKEHPQPVVATARLPQFLTRMQRSAQDLLSTKTTEPFECTSIPPKTRSGQTGTPSLPQASAVDAADLTQNRKSGGSAVAVGIWDDYPGPNEVLPQNLSLYQVANQYPNHLFDAHLDAFIRARWSAGEIQECMPIRCQRDLNARSARDKKMWIQKRLQAREGFIQASRNDWKTLWESPNTRADGRPIGAKTTKSLQEPKQTWLDKYGLLDVSPAGTVEYVNRKPVWKEPVGVSYFLLKPTWSSRVGARSRKRPFSTGNTGNRASSGTSSRSGRRRTAPAKGLYGHEEDEDEESSFDVSDQPARSSWRRSRQGSGDWSDDSHVDLDCDEGCDGEEEDEEDGDAPRRKRAKPTPMVARPKPGMR